MAAALINMPLIDEKLCNIAVNFWGLTWNLHSVKATKRFKMALLLTLE